MTYYVKIVSKIFTLPNTTTRQVKLKLIPTEEQPKFWWYKKVKTFTLSNRKPEHKNRFHLIESFLKLYGNDNLPRVIPGILFEGKEYYDREKNRMRLQVTTTDYYYII